LSLDIMTSVGECTPGLTNRLQPLTMCEYDVDCEDIADLRGAASQSRYGVTREELECPWLSYLLAGKEAPSWLAADRIKSSGHTGIIVPSFVPGATEANSNLVLSKWSQDLPHKVDVYDPSGRLPRNQLWWPAA
jgi:RES domain-containing protein